MNHPNYYAILTAEVRYSNKINANEKLLFAEIMALSNKTGECWASNNYFATLYDVSPQAVSKWINNLSKVGFITLDYIYKSGSKEIEKRIIRGINRSLYVSTYDSEVSTYDSEVSTTDCGGYQHTIKDNNTSINNKQNIKQNKATKVVNVVEFDFNGFNKEEIEAIKDWIQYKKESKQSYKPTALKALRTKLINLKNKGQLISSINNSIGNNWSGLFEDKTITQTFTNQQQKQTPDDDSFSEASQRKFAHLWEPTL